MTADEFQEALAQARLREEALSRRLDAIQEQLRQRDVHLGIQRAILDDLRTSAVEFDRLLLVRVVNRINRVRDAAQPRTLTGRLWQRLQRARRPRWLVEPLVHTAGNAVRLRQRFREAGLPLSWIVRHPLRFARGASRLRSLEFRRQVAELAGSGLFDPNHYRAVTGVGPLVNIVARFLLGGDAAGESSHPLFDPQWYRRHADRPDGEPALQHYLRAGGWEFRSPHPLFDARYYLSQFPPGSVQAPTPLTHFLAIGSLGAASPHPLFDVKHYLAQREEYAEADNLLLHYLGTATTDGLDPHPLFSTRYYIEFNPDLRGHNPLDHFVREGAAEGRSPHPLFDVRFYWEQRPEVRRTGGNALLDFLARALEEDVDPHPLFDTSYYLAHAPGVRELGLNPLLHFLEWGWRHGLRPNAWFDPHWYLEQNPDVFDQNPLLHFMEVGWSEGRDPSPEFSLSAYMAAHPEIAELGVNPLEHFLRQAHEGDQATARTTRWAAAATAGPIALRVQSGESAGRELVPTLLSTLAPLTTFRMWIDARSASPDALETTLRSLRDQHYQQWNALVLVGDARPGPRGPADPRIDFHSIDVSAPLRLGAAVPDDRATFVGLLAPGDALEPHALLLAAHAVQGGRRTVDLVYADEDVVESGRRPAAVFKPDWDPLLFASVDYLGPCAFVRASLVRTALSGDAPLDLTEGARHRLLRAVLAGVDQERSVHLSYVLGHTPPATGYQARAAAASASKLEALAAEVYGPPGAEIADPLVSILIPTRDRVELLSRCVESVLSVTAYPSLEIIVVDNDSESPAARAWLSRLEERPRCRVLRYPGPFNFSALNNHAASEARGQILCLLNNDIEITEPSWLGAMVAFARQPHVGAVGTNLVYPDGTIQHGGVIVGAGGVAGHAFVGKRPTEPTYMNLVRLPREVSAVTAACMAVARERYFEVDGLDEKELQVNFSDTDLCLKLRTRGYRNVILPIAGIIHHESASRGAVTRTTASMRQLEREALSMKQRWGALLRRDPYYNDNLTLTGETYLVERRSAPVPARSATARPAANYTSLGRDARLDIYADAGNEMRAAHAARPRPPLPPLPSLPPGVSVLILNKNAPELLIPLVGQLEGERAAFGEAGLGCEVIIGDTGTTDPSVLGLYDRPPDGVRVVRGLRYNFSRCNNTLEGLAAFDTVLFLNNDIILPPEPGALLQGFRTLVSTPGLGVLGAVLFYPDGTIQHMGCALLTEAAHWGLPYHVNTRTRVPAASIPRLARYPGVTGAFLMTRRRLFRQLGGFDPLYAAERQDVALCLDAARLGFASACADLGGIVHIENATRPKGEENWTDRRRFLRKHGAFIQSVSP